jgi:16S rRNA (cytosine967-C5)-methyltransferase
MEQTTANIGGRFLSYLNTAVQLITTYEGTAPFAQHLKQHFTKHKKHGSKDRKLIAQLCYCYFRLGKALGDLSVAEKVKTALFLCQPEVGPWAVLFSTDWLTNWSTETTERVAFVTAQYPSFNVLQIFNWSNTLSIVIEPEAFCISHLIQPAVFVRIRPGKQHKVQQQFQTQQIPYQQVTVDGIALEPSVKLETILQLDKDAVVQDLSSQQIADYLHTIKSALSSDALRKGLKVWDCCAASGGKSILAKDVFQHLQLTVSDIRTTILHNLKQRFAAAGMGPYKMLEVDLTGSNELPDDRFQLIICDAPCSGSGTWGRTPEQLVHFKSADIAYYASLQRSIVTNAVQRLTDDGYLLYITCSVFKAENEQVVEYISNQLQLHLVSSGIIAGYEKRADSMFAALFTA